MNPGDRVVISRPNYPSDSFFKGKHARITKVTGRCVLLILDGEAAEYMFWLRELDLISAVE